MRTGLWVLMAALVLFPVGYFILSWPDYAFRIGAIGNWFGTVVGVIVGIPVGMSLARAQESARAESERSRDEKNRREILRSMRHRLYGEIEFNLTLVKSLSDVLGKSPAARADVWNWAVEIMAQVEIDAYRELDAMLIPEERVPYAAVSLAYGDLRRLAGRIREGSAAHSFLYGYSADEASANRRLEEATRHAHIVDSELTSALAKFEVPS
jgi:hypothetical protein